MNFRFVVEPFEAGQRIDKYLAEKCPQLSRSFIQKQIGALQVSANDKIIKSNYKTSSSDVIVFENPEPVERMIASEELDLNIVYEDNEVLVVNKPKGMVVHPAPGHYSGTLVNGLLHHCKSELSGINGELRPGIVHRIDRDTTGLLVVCKTDLAHISLSEQLKAHTTTRRYRAIVHGVIKQEQGVIETPIGRHPIDRKRMAVNVMPNREAVTHYRVLERFSNYTYIECQLKTGRTHQIRVHMASIHHPLLGDGVYGNMKSPYRLEGQTLHAKVLGFIHPVTDQYMEFDSELPDYFMKLLEDLRRKS